jgi:hypothetical protein
MSTAAPAMSQNSRPEQRPRSKSTFSLKSDKSSKKHQRQHSKQSSQGENHHHHEKVHTAQISTKADPNSAMNEVQPIAAALEKPTLQSLRSFQHTDVNGNPIADPDLSNPTRSRWERPLDTIRSFEAAIDSEYKRRSMAMRGDSSDAMSTYASRRNSYYAGGYEQNNRYQSGGGGYYGNRQSAAPRESWNDHGFPAGPGPRSKFHRTQYDSGWNPRQSTGHNVYPTPGYQQSRDTVITGGSDSNHSAGPYSTDPSSENSSIERGGPVKQPGPDLGEQYGFSGFGGNGQPIHEELGNYSGHGYGGPSNNGSNGYFQQQHDTNYAPPPVPMKAAGQPAPNNPNMIKLNTNGPEATAAGGRPNVLSRKSTEASEKRKSWFKRRFSKN